MALPFFMPTERLQQGTWMHPSRLPLGAGWKGRCCAPGCEAADVPLNVLESFCNMGYAAALSQPAEGTPVRFGFARGGPRRKSAHRFVVFMRAPAPLPQGMENSNNTCR